MSKIKEKLQELEDKGLKAFDDTPDCANDAHGEDDK